MSIDTMTPVSVINVDGVEVPVAGGKGFDLSMLPKYTSSVKIDLSSNTTTQSLNGLVQLNIVESSNFVVDWGDGSPIEAYSEAATELIHQYEDSNFKGYIKFYGDWAGLDTHYSPPGVKKAIKRIFYDENIGSVPAEAFRDCGGLNYFEYKYFPKSGDDGFIIGDYAFAYTSLVDFDFSRVKLQNAKNVFQMAFGSRTNTLHVKPRVNMLANASGICATNTHLQYIIFDEANVTSEMFYNCSSIKRIDMNPCRTSKIYLFSRAFAACSGLEMLVCHNSQYGITAYSSDAIPDSIKTILIDYRALSAVKKETNLAQHANKIYPISGQYSETVIIPVADWVDNSQTVEVIGSTTEARNIIEFMLVDANGNQVEDTYGLSAVQGTTQMTFTCKTVPTEDIYVFVKSTLTNY